MRVLMAAEKCDLFMWGEVDIYAGRALGWCGDSAGVARRASVVGEVGAKGPACHRSGRVTVSRRGVLEGLASESLVGQRPFRGGVQGEP